MLIVMILCGFIEVWTDETDGCHFFSADAHRALELLEDYHSQLTNAAERPLRSAIERVIRIFKSRLFQALLGKLWYICQFKKACKDHMG